MMFINTTIFVGQDHTKSRDLREALRFSVILTHDYQQSRGIIPSLLYHQMFRNGHRSTRRHHYLIIRSPASNFLTRFMTTTFFVN